MRKTWECFSQQQNKNLRFENNKIESALKKVHKKRHKAYGWTTLRLSFYEVMREHDFFLYILLAFNWWNFNSMHAFSAILDQAIQILEN